MYPAPGIGVPVIHMEDAREIYDRAAEWRERLRNSRYAGQIYLDRGSLVRLARQFTRFMPPGDDLYETALVVLAVNCAYHDYDDAGFWPHFCRLLKIENTNANQQRIGQLIEKRLDLLGLKRTDRTGPFRYVGAILEQCGVSRRYTAPFAGLIKELKGPRPWEVLIATSWPEFRDRVDMSACPRYLKDFLMDVAGWQFTVQVCRLLMLYQLGCLTPGDLEGLPGYQPAFWTEFAAYFRPQKTCGVPVALRPRLLFLPEEQCPAILFPGRQYPYGVTHPAIAGFWRFPLTPLKRVEAWSNYYAGWIPGPGGEPAEWAVPGWLPDGLPALFHPRYGYLPRGSRVVPGEYYLLVPDGQRPPHRVIWDMGDAWVPGNRNYRAFRVSVGSPVRIRGYEYDRDTDEDIVLRWSEPERFLVWCTDPRPDIFSGMLPRPLVSDFVAIEEQRAVLCYVAGSDAGRIRNREQLEQIRGDINRKAPLTGRFLAAMVGRTEGAAGVRRPAELEFCLLPRLDVRFERRLYSFNEEPAVEIDAGFPGRLHLDGCCRVDPDGRSWIVTQNEDTVTGTIECRGLDIGVHIAVHRARMYLPDGSPVRYLLRTELEKRTTLLLKGYPEADARIGLWQQPGGGVPVKFDAGGLAQIATEQLLKLMDASGNAIVEIVLTLDGYTVTTGTVVIDPAAVTACIHGGTGCSACVHTAGNLMKILDLCARICRGLPPGQRYNLERVPGFHPELDEWIFSLLACAEIFDGVEISVGGRRFDWTKEIAGEDLRLVLELARGFPANGRGGTVPLAGKELLPPVERWRRAPALTLMPHTAEWAPDFSEWADEVGRHLVVFRNNIARLQGGHALTAAWVHYHRGLFESSLSLLANIEHGPGVVTGLRNFLRALVLMRLTRFEPARDVVESGNPAPFLKPLFTLLRYILETIAGDRSEPPIPHPDLLDVLPLRPEDKAFLDLAVEAGNGNGPSAVAADSPASGDWLTLWFLLNSCPDTREKARLAGKLLGLFDRIPASPEKAGMKEILKKIPGVKGDGPGANGRSDRPA